MKKEEFFGKRDPNRIMLQNVFKQEDGIVFTTPLDEQGKIHRVFVESVPAVSEYLNDEFSALFNVSMSSGKWCGIVSDGEGLTILTYDRKEKSVEKNLEILTQVLYMDLALICDMKLFNHSHISVFQRNTRVCSKVVKLPESVPNGTKEIPEIWTPPVYIC